MNANLRGSAFWASRAAAALRGVASLQDQAGYGGSAADARKEAEECERYLEAYASRDSAAREMYAALAAIADGRGMTKAEMSAHAARALAKADGLERLAPPTTHRSPHRTRWGAPCAEGRGTKPEDRTMQFRTAINQARAKLSAMVGRLIVRLDASTDRINKEADEVLAKKNRR